LLSTGEFLKGFAYVFPVNGVVRVFIPCGFSSGGLI